MAVNSPEVRTIFSRSLLNCPSLDLWTTYLNFIKRVSCLAWPTLLSVPDVQLQVPQGENFALKGVTFVRTALAGTELYMACNACLHGGATACPCMV